MFKFINKSMLYVSAIVLTVASGYFAFATWSGNSGPVSEASSMEPSVVPSTAIISPVLEPAALTPAVNPVREIDVPADDAKIDKVFFPKGSAPQVGPEGIPIEEYNGKPMIIVVRRISDMKGVCETTE